MVRAYPFERLPVIGRADLALGNALARWVTPRPHGRRVETLVGGAVKLAAITRGELGDPHAAACELRIARETFEVRAPGLAVRAVAQRLLGGPVELVAPRPLGAVEHAIWALVVAAAVEDLGIAGEVWACEEPQLRGPDERRSLLLAFELLQSLAGASLTVSIRVPDALELRPPPARAPAWPARMSIDVPVVVGRCAITRAALGALTTRSVITIEAAAGQAELAILGGVVGIAQRADGVVAEVTTGYIPRSMALPDDAHVELTVGLGTTQLSLRQVFELAIGQVVPLNRPLAGPFEIRAAGQLVGSGELVNVDGELGVRIVSLEE